MAGESLLGSVGNFITSPVGAGLLGAGLGYGVGQLTGASPEQSALYGLGGGLLGYGGASAMSPDLASQAVDYTTPAWLQQTGDVMGLLGKGAETYGNIQSGMSQRALAEGQLGLLNTQNRLALDEYNRQKQREQATQEALSGGFQQSGLANYYSA